MKPTATGSSELYRIQRLSRLLAASCLVLMLFLPAFDAFVWSWASVSDLAVIFRIAPGTVKGELLAWQRIAGGLLMMLPFGCQIAGLWESRKCFRLFASGRIFVRDAVRCLRRFAAWMLASIFADSVADSALSVVMTAGNPPGQRVFSIGFGFDVNMAVFIGIVWLMAAVIGHGQSIAEENASFV